MRAAGSGIKSPGANVVRRWNGENRRPWPRNLRLRQGILSGQFPRRRLGNLSRRVSDIESPHQLQVEVVDGESLARAICQVARKALQQLPPVFRSPRSGLFRFHDPPADLPIGAGHDRVDRPCRGMPGGLRQIDRLRQGRRDGRRNAARAGFQPRTRRTVTDECGVKAGVAGRACPQGPWLTIPPRGFLPIRAGLHHASCFLMSVQAPACSAAGILAGLDDGERREGLAQGASACQQKPNY